MKFITEIINDLKKCSNWCCHLLFPQSQPTKQHNLQQPLIELQTFEHHLKPSLRRQQSRKRSASLQQNFSLKEEYDFNDEIITSTNLIKSSGSNKDQRSHFFQNPHLQNQEHEEQKPVIIKRVESRQMRSSQRKSSSQSSFQTLKSSASRPISRRNFKILRKSSSFYAKHRSNQDDFYSVNQSQNSNFKGNQNRILTFKFAENNQNYRDGIDMMNIWIKKQYEPYPIKTYKPVLSEITKMKLSTKDVFDTLVHKLQDYYTFYFEDQHFQTPQNLSRSMSKHYQTQTHQPSFTYEEKNGQMICSVNKADSSKDSSFQKSCKYMSLIIIPFCSLPPLAFLQWFNKLEVQSSLHCFNKIEYLENSQIVDEKISLQYPLMRVEQFNEKLIGKKTFILARQIEVANFQNQEDKQTLLQVFFEAIDEQKCFERLVRVTAEPNDGSRVEIYIESSENIIKRQASQLLKAMKKQEGEKNFEFVYFEERWKKFEQKLNRNQIINKKQVQVFQN